MASHWVDAALYPYNSVTATDKDLSTVTFFPYIKVVDSAKIVLQFMDRLTTQKMTVNAGVQSFVAAQALARSPIMVTDSNPANGLPTFRSMTTDDIVIGGDIHTTIHGLYSGTDTVPTLWYRGN